MTDLIFIIHFTLSMGLFYTCFCRLVHTDKNVAKVVRASLVILGMASLVVGAAPVLWGMHPNIWTMLVLGATLFSKVVGSKVWANGVPAAFMKVLPSSLNTLTPAAVLATIKPQSVQPTQPVSSLSQAQTLPLSKSSS